MSKIFWNLMYKAIPIMYQDFQFLTHKYQNSIMMPYLLLCFRTSMPCGLWWPLCCHLISQRLRQTELSEESEPFSRCFHCNCLPLPIVMSLAFVRCYAFSHAPQETELSCCQNGSKWVWRMGSLLNCNCVITTLPTSPVPDGR